MAALRRHLLDRPVTWVALAGFMGTGKSRIGWELSRRLQLTFIDTDRVIERVSCMRVSEIFDLYGEAVFRDYETEVVRRCTRLDEVVVSTGGGTVVREENRRLLRERGPVVVLEASPETIYKRTRRHKRPMLETADPHERIAALLQARTPAYAEVATITVSTEARESRDVVEEIVQRLEAWSAAEDAGAPEDAGDAEDAVDTDDAGDARDAWDAGDAGDAGRGEAGDEAEDGASAASSLGAPWEPPS